jgi:hypothetical protein
MAVNEELAGFVREALSRKVSRPDIEQALLRGGWTKEQTRAALDAFVDTDCRCRGPGRICRHGKRSNISYCS